jgi:sulfur-oxidizing protein SoxY
MTTHLDDRAPTRRDAMARVVHVVVGASFAPLLGIGPARATPAMLQAAIDKLVGGQKITEGRVKLEIPPLVENGNTVPLTVSVESPMTEADHVVEIHILNEKNPQPYVIGVKIGPRAGKARFATRAKLSDSQRVVAIAKMNDGSFWSDSADVIVTIAACVEMNE